MRDAFSEWNDFMKKIALENATPALTNAVSDVMVEPLPPVPIPHTSAWLARGIRAGRWIFATGRAATEYINGLAPEVVRAEHPGDCRGARRRTLCQA